MKVTELTHGHLGMELLVEAPYWYISGVLDSVHHNRVYVDELALCDEESAQILVGVTTTLVVSGWERTIPYGDSVGVEIL